MKLSYRDSGASGTQLTVFSGNLAIAILWQYRSGASKSDDWRWMFTLTAGPAGFQHQGKATNREEAKATLENNWQRWLDAASLSER